MMHESKDRYRHVLMGEEWGSTICGLETDPVFKFIHLSGPEEFVDFIRNYGKEGLSSVCLECMKECLPQLPETTFSDVRSHVAVAAIHNS